MFRNKLLLASPIIAFIVIFIFSLTLFPSVQPEVTNLPIAIVNEDEGVSIPGGAELNMGQTILEMMEQQAAAAEGEPAVKWIKVNSKEQVIEGLNNSEYYAALVIPREFSAGQASLRTPTPSSPQVEIFINQGMHAAASTMAGQMLHGIMDNVSINMRTQILEGFAAQDATLTVQQAASLATPIEKVVTNVNAVGENSANGNSPLSFFQPIWIASLAAAVIMFFVVSKLPISEGKEGLWAKLGQIGASIALSFVIGFSLTWLAGDMLGFSIPSFIETALFLTLSAFSFIMMILAVLSLLGIKGMPLFVLLLFFGAPLLSMAPEMLSPFYRDWIYPWLPTRFMVDGLRELFFFEKGLYWSASVNILFWIAVVGMLVIMLSTFTQKLVKKQIAV